MRKARVFMHGIEAGKLEAQNNGKFQFIYLDHYQGPPVSLTMPVVQTPYISKTFPSFFEGLLPEGIMLDALLRKYKIDKSDYFGQLMIVGHDVVGAVTIEEME